MKTLVEWIFALFAHFLLQLRIKIPFTDWIHTHIRHLVLQTSLGFGQCYRQDRRRKRWHQQFSRWSVMRQTESLPCFFFCMYLSRANFFAVFFLSLEIQWISETLIEWVTLYPKEWFLYSENVRSACMQRIACIAN